MFSLSPTPKTFSLLSIGQRGVGKTVFLAGSYAELRPDPLHGTSQPIWFECQNVEVQENLEKIGNHVRKTGLYPPATIKITNFNFSLKQRGLWGIKTLCRFRWWDIPGESCHIRNPDFQAMVLASHGCCVFISADALVQRQDYATAIEDLFNQVIAIASIVSQNRLNYAFALILTKCDLVESGAITQLQLEQNLQPLITRLDKIKANYQKFYSAIPIVSMEGVSSLRARGAASPLLWLLAELNKHHQFHNQHNLADGLSRNLAVSQALPSSLRRYVFALSFVSLLVLATVISFLVVTRFTVSPQPSAQEQSNHLITRRIYSL